MARCTRWLLLGLVLAFSLLQALSALEADQDPTLYDIRKQDQEEADPRYDPEYRNTIEQPPVDDRFKAVGVKLKDEVDKEKKEANDKNYINAEKTQLRNIKQVSSEIEEETEVSFDSNESASNSVGGENLQEREEEIISNEIQEQEPIGEEREEEEEEVEQETQEDEHEPQTSDDDHEEEIEETTNEEPEYVEPEVEEEIEVESQTEEVDMPQYNTYNGYELYNGYESYNNQEPDVTETIDEEIENELPINEIQSEENEGTFEEEMEESDADREYEETEHIEEEAEEHNNEEVYEEEEEAETQENEHEVEEVEEEEHTEEEEEEIQHEEIQETENEEEEETEVEEITVESEEEEELPTDMESSEQYIEEEFEPEEDIEDPNYGSETGVPVDEYEEIIDEIGQSSQSEEFKVPKIFEYNPQMAHYKEASIILGALLDPIDKDYAEEEYEPIVQDEEGVVPGWFQDVQLEPVGESPIVVPPPEASDRCSQAPETGPCKAAMPRYYYDSNTKECQQFVYGGCNGNRNNFESLSECVSECVGDIYS